MSDIEVQPDPAVRPERRRATSADVARASGVSRATVSYVLNNVPGKTISDRTRELVLQKARELGHLPFAPARSLRLGRSDVVLALVRDFGLGYVSNVILQDLDVALAERGYLVIVHRYDAALRSIPDLWGAVTPALVVAMGGMSVTDSDLTMIEGTNTQILKVHGQVRHSEAGRMQVEYLTGKGHERLGYAYPVAGNVQLVAQERFAGAEAALAQTGLPAFLTRQIDIDEPTTVDEAVDAWLADGVTAVCAHNDEIALMIIESLHLRGIEAGSRFAVIGNDNIPAARMNVTTVRVDAEAWSGAVVRSVLALLDGEEPEPVSGDFLSLIVRASA